MNEFKVRIKSDILSGPLIGLWGTLLDLSERIPDNWTLIGGQMVLLHGLECDRTPPGVSLDLDVLADIRSNRKALRDLVISLGELGFSSAGVSPEGKAHRYKRAEDGGDLIVDLLAPDNVGPRADLTTTPPDKTLEAPGGTQAVRRSEKIYVQIDERVGSINRPNLLGAIVGKAAALGIATGNKEKNYRDLVFLLSLPANPMSLRSELTPGDRKKLRLAERLCDDRHPAWRELDDAEARLDGQAMYKILLS